MCKTIQFYVKAHILLMHPQMRTKRSKTILFKYENIKGTESRTHCICHIKQNQTEALEAKMEFCDLKTKIKLLVCKVKNLFSIFYMKLH